MSQLTKAPMRGVPVTLHNSASALSRGVVLAVPSSFHHHRILIQTGAGVASGAIQPETSNLADNTGTWAPIGGGPITVPAASSSQEYNFTGVYQFLAARISTVIGGGTVTVTYEGS